MSPSQALSKFIDSYHGGNKTRAAEALNVSRMIIYWWFKNPTKISYEVAIKIERLTNHQILASSIKPDLKNLLN